MAITDIKYGWIAAEALGYSMRGGNNKIVSFKVKPLHEPRHEGQKVPEYLRYKWHVLQQRYFYPIPFKYFLLLRRCKLIEERVNSNLVILINIQYLAGHFFSAAICIKPIVYKCELHCIVSGVPGTMYCKIVSAARG